MSFNTTTVLVMLSGGLDSTYMLHHYLTNTDYRVVSHHISHRYESEPRWRAEDAATDKIVEYCKGKYREFRHTSTVFDFRQFRRHVGWDSDLQILVASKVAPNLFGNVSVAIGWTADDIERSIVQDRIKRGCTENMWKVCRDSIDSTTVRKRVNPKLWMPFVENKIYKKDIYKLCPAPLRKLAWSCRRPKYKADGTAMACGSCLPCRELIKINN
jgi:hypothetical protein